MGCALAKNGADVSSSNHNTCCCLCDSGPSSTLLLPRRRSNTHCCPVQVEVGSWRFLWQNGNNYIPRILPFNQPHSNKTNNNKKCNLFGWNRFHDVVAKIIASKEQLSKFRRPNFAKSTHLPLLSISDNRLSDFTTFHQTSPADSDQSGSPDENRKLGHYPVMSQSSSQGRHHDTGQSLYVLCPG